jgi:dTDP-4-dehydrorhamnose 3,5-epimerase
MKVSASGLPEVLILEPQMVSDERGFFMESFNERVFAGIVADAPRFVQDNQSHSIRGSLRGLHYQLAPHAQGKLVRVAGGRVFDVAVDIRRGSPRFGSWTGIELSDENRLQMWIPPGFAHGFQVLSDNADVLYKTTDFWFGALDRSIRWDDPALSIAWPLPGAPILSAKDAAAPLLAQAELFD